MMQNMIYDELYIQNQFGNILLEIIRPEIDTGRHCDTGEYLKHFRIEGRVKEIFYPELIQKCINEKIDCNITLVLNEKNHKGGMILFGNGIIHSLKNNVINLEG